MTKTENSVKLIVHTKHKYERTVAFARGNTTNVRGVAVSPKFDAISTSCGGRERWFKSRGLC